MSSNNPMKKNPLNKLKKAAKPAENAGSKKAPQTRSQKIFRGPLFWIIVAIFGVTIFGQITNAANRYTEIKTSQAADAISKFSDSANDQIPALVLFTGEITPEKIASAEAFAQNLGSKILVHSDGKLLTDADGKEVSIPISDYFIEGVPITTFPSEDGKAILANFPISVQIATELLPDGKEPARVLPE